MAAESLEHADQARAALRAIVSDPDYGAEALSNPQTMANLLRDFLPDAPREAGLLIAAASAGLPTMIRGHIAEGIDATTAIRLAASSLATTTAFTTDACEWVASALGAALNLTDGSENAAHAGSARVAPELPRATASPSSPTLADSMTSALASGLMPATSPVDGKIRRRATIAVGLLIAALAVIGSFAVGYSTGKQHAIVRIRTVTRTHVVSRTERAAASVPCWIYDGFPWPAPVSTQPNQLSRCTIRIDQPTVAVYGAFAVLTDPSGQSADFTLVKKGA